MSTRICFSPLLFLTQLPIIGTAARLIKLNLHVISLHHSLSLSLSYHLVHWPSYPSGSAPGFTSKESHPLPWGSSSCLGHTRIEMSFHTSSGPLKPTQQLWFGSLLTLRRSRTPEVLFQGMGKPLLRSRSQLLSISHSTIHAAYHASKPS